MIEANNIHYSAGNKRILQQVSFQAQPGQLTVLLGANGAGKSTLLRLLAGEMYPQSGQLMFNGQQIHSYSPAQLALHRAVLTQHFTVTLPFTCEEIVMMGRYPHYGQTPAQADHNIVAANMNDLNITHFRKRQFNTLSGGEQQRVQFARVLTQLDAATNPTKKMLLLDEPTASMDYLHQQRCLRKAREVARMGCTVIVVLHDLNLAAQFADHILLLREGLLIGKDTPAQLLTPDIIQMTYGIAVNVIHHHDYPFPIIIPILDHQQHSINALNKSTYANSNTTPER